MTPIPSAFARLRDLLEDVPVPTGRTPIPLHLGQQQRASSSGWAFGVPGPEGWHTYPPPGGTPELRDAYVGWLERRFGVGAAVDDGRIAVEPTPGTKQSVAAVLALAVARVRWQHTPTVVLPNPSYPAYPMGASTAGASVEYYAIVDDIASAVTDAVHRCVCAPAAIVVCNPGNPRGEILSAKTLREIARVATSVGALLVIDECYTDSWWDRPPPGFLPLVDGGEVNGDCFVVLHSLSKRSGAPGLRSGFVAGDPRSVADYSRYNRGCGVSASVAVCRAAAELWADDDHVEALRSSVKESWHVADEVFTGVPGYGRAGAGFFLWLPVADDEHLARTLWRDHAVSVMPGRYLSALGADGTDPGLGHIRVALVHEPDVLSEALARVREALLDDN